MKRWFKRIAARLAGLSFRAGVIVLLICGLCYAISFAQMLFPLPAWVKGVLWAVFYGCAKAAQYSALLILGKAGLQRIRNLFGSRVCRQD